MKRNLLKRGGRGWLAVLLLALLLSSGARGQVFTNYAFAATAGTYTPLTGGINPRIFGGVNEGVFDGLPIGFTFVFNGTPYTTVSASTNGFLVFDQVLLSAIAANNLATGTTRSLVAPLWDDLSLTATTDFTYLTSGAAGSRVFTAEWNNVKWQATATGTVISFQARLYEGTGKVEYVYQQGATAVATGTASIGMSGTGSTGANTFLSLGSTSTAPTVSTTAETATLSTKPASGQTYGFTPPAATATAPSGLVFSSVQGGGFTLGFTDNSTNETGFLIERSTDNVNFIIVTKLAANTTTYTDKGLAASTTYYYRVSALREGNLSAAATGQQATTLGTFCGTVVVGPSAGAAYATLTSAFSAVASQGVCAAGATLELQATYAGSTTETFPIVYSAVGTASGPVTVRPAAGATNLVISNTNATAIFMVNGGRHLILDGRPGGVSGTASTYLRLRNTNASGPVVVLQNDATNNTISYCQIEGTATTVSTATVILSDIVVGDARSGDGATGNDQNSILNNDIRNRSDIADSNTNGPITGIYSASASSLALNDANVVQGNRIFGYGATTGSSGAGIRLNQTGTGDGWIIGGSGAGQGNEFFLTTARTVTSTGIEINGGNSHQVVGNSVYQAAGGLAAFRGINISTGSGHTVNSNKIGGSAADASGTAISVTGASTQTVYGILLSVGTSPATEVQGNLVRNISNTSTAAAGVATMGIFQNSGTANIGTTTPNTVGDAAAALGFKSTSSIAGIYVSTQATIQNNTVNNVQLLSGALAGASLYGIIVPAKAGSTPSVVQSNTVSNLSVQSGAGDGANMAGIQVQGGINHSVLSNTVRGVANGANSVGTNTAQTVGIFCVGGTGGTGAMTATNNTISDIGSTSTVAPNTTTTTNLVVGFSFLDAGSGSVLRSNRLFNIYSTAPGFTSPNVQDGVQAVSLYGATNGITLVNNQIAVARADASNAQVAGIVDGTSSGVGGNNLYYNTVYLTGGSAGSGASYAFRRTGGTAATPTATGTWRNNIFYNGRTGTAGANYAVGTTLTSGWAATALDYNLFIVANAATMGEWATGANRTFAAWKAAQPSGSGGDASSLSELSTVVPAASLFVDPSLTSGIFATGNLNINTGNVAAWYANGNGVQVAGESGDFATASGVRSVTVAGGGTDIGSNEFTPTVAPPALAVSGAPALGGTQTFTYGGRTFATVVYRNTGTVPTTVTGSYYSGTNPPTPYAAGARYSNMYLNFAATGGSGYTYTLTLAYDPALLGTVPTEAAQRVSQQTSTTYGTYFGTLVNTSARTLDANAPLTRFGVFAVSDAAAPLPVSLSAFAAQREENEAYLTWTTASENNSRGFDVQVSVDGGTFRALGFVASETPASTAPRHYAFRDREAGKAGTRYYRLLHHDLDGTASASPLRAVRFDVAAAPGTLTASPNPFQQRLILKGQFATTQGGELHLADAAGLTLLRQFVPAFPAAGGELEVAGASQLPTGVYFISLLLPGQPTQHLKVVKQ